MTSFSVRPFVLNFSATSQFSLRMKSSISRLFVSWFHSSSGAASDMNTSHLEKWEIDESRYQ